MAGFPLIPQLRNLSRFLAASMRNGTVRFYVGDLEAFYGTLNEAGVAYVVLRWSEDMPRSVEEEAKHKDDIDHLVADKDIRRLIWLAARHPGPIKSDHYSLGGRRGSSYKSMPYYMPELGQRILGDRQLDPRGFYRPSSRHEFLAFAYHLAYHKGLSSGLDGGLPGCPPAEPAKKDYAAELNRLAELAEYGALPDPLTLFSLHGMLKSEAWSMPSDLMTRWPKPHPFMTALLQYETESAKPLIETAKGHTVFILRDDCDTPELEQLALSMIAERFEILKTIRLDADMRRRLIAQTRGGSWIEKGRDNVIGPTVAVVCKDAETPGPLPVKMSPEKVAKRYPHLANTDALIKRNIRDAVNAASGPPSGRVVIHATDNAFECADIFSALFEDEALTQMREIMGAQSVVTGFSETHSFGSTRDERALSSTHRTLVSDIEIPCKTPQFHRDRQAAP